MMKRNSCVLVFFLMLGCTVFSGMTVAQSARLMRYTQQQSGGNNVPLGVPVPMPVSSTTAVDGFRTYKALTTQLGSLAIQSPDVHEHEVGKTQGYRRPMFAYVLSDKQGVDMEGFMEPSFLMQGSVHAREWGTHEVTAGLIEYMADQANDGGMVRYLLDNTRLVVLPNANADGLVQTQTYPDQVWYGTAPESRNQYPRDGRMRRKNMRGVDADIHTRNDHLFGIDLNRQHQPFWAATDRSSFNPQSIVYHGSAAYSENESQALLNAAALVPPESMRLGIDVHSFSKVFFCINTGNTRLNNIQQSLMEVIRAHHRAHSKSKHRPSGADYLPVCDPPKTGIGAGSEFMGFTFNVPAWTLELEPEDHLGRYGGYAVSHSGFILPESEVRRVRDAWAKSHVMSMYRMAGPPVLLGVEWRHSDGAKQLVQQSQWVKSGEGRIQAKAMRQPLVRGQTYKLHLRFSKPMRAVNDKGEASGDPGIVDSSAWRNEPKLWLSNGNKRVPLTLNASNWRSTRYVFDSFETSVTLPTSLVDGAWQLEVDVHDRTLLALDAKPNTRANLVEGVWKGYESSDGSDRDRGGADNSTSWMIASQASSVRLKQANMVTAEGSKHQMVFEASDVASLNALQVEGDVTDVQWSEVDERRKTRTLTLTLPDDLEVNDATLASVTVGMSTNAKMAWPMALLVLDNDSDTQRVERRQISRQFPDSVTNQTTVAHVMDADQRLSVFEMTEATQTQPHQEPQIKPKQTMWGNGALLAGRSCHGTQDNPQPMWHVWPEQTWVLDGWRVNDDRDAGADKRCLGGLLTNHGDVTMRRSVVDGRDATAQGGAYVHNHGQMTIKQSHVSQTSTSGDASVPSIEHHEGTLTLTNSAMSMTGSSAALFVHPQATIKATHASFTHRRSAVTDVSTGFVFEVQNSALHDVFAEYVKQSCQQAVWRNMGSSKLLDDGVDGSFNQCFDGFSRDDVLSESASLIDLVADKNCMAGVDIEGRPRPQRGDNGTTACDVGAWEAGINPTRGLWSTERMPHTGLALETQGNQLLMFIYTYDEAGQPVAYEAHAPLTGADWQQDLMLFRQDPTTKAISTKRVGNVSLRFDADDQVQVTWALDEASQNHPFKQVEAVFKPVVDVAQSKPNFESSGLWFDPHAPGFGVNIMTYGQVLAGVFYYFDQEGDIRWVIAAGEGQDVVDMPISAYQRTPCDDCADGFAYPNKTIGQARMQQITPERTRIWFDLHQTQPFHAAHHIDAGMLVPMNDLRPVVTP